MASPDRRWPSGAVFWALGALAAATPARAGLRLLPSVRLDVEYADNPFFDNESTTPDAIGSTMRLGVSPSLYLALGGLTVDAEAYYDRYVGDVAATAWGASGDVAWARALTASWAMRAEVEGRFSRVQLDAMQDDLLWSAGTLAATWTPIADFEVGVEGGLGGRFWPDRADDAGSTDGVSERLTRGQIRAGYGPTDSTWLSLEYEVLRADASAAWRASTLHVGELAVRQRVGPIELRASGAAWARSFDDDRADAAAAGQLRAAWRPWPDVRLQARYRYITSTSNDTAGEYRQHLAGLAISGWLDASPEPPPPPVPAHRPVRTEKGWRFTVDAPSAKQVALVGSFNDWTAEQGMMRADETPGRFIIETPLAPGRYTYMFLIDGEIWQTPPDAPGYADDGFGGTVGVLTVPPT